MKKLLIIACTFMMFKGIASNTGSDLLAVPTHTRITKSNGGFFGYKTVDQNIGTENAMLACADPGFKRCKFSALPTAGPLTTEDTDAIDTQVLSAINAGHYSGQFAYNTNYLVVYTYNIDTNNSSYDVYTRDEAKALGYSF